MTTVHKTADVTVTKSISCLQALGTFECRFMFLPAYFHASYRVDARQLGQLLRQRLQLAEVPAALPLLPIDLPQQEVPVDI